MYDIPPLLDHFIEYVCYFLERWGYHWWEGTDHHDNPVPWIIEFQRRILASRSPHDQRMRMQESRRNSDIFIKSREIVYRIDLRTVFNKMNFRTVDEVKKFVPLFLKHFIWGSRRHQEYFHERLGLKQSSSVRQICDAYLQARVYDDRTLFRQLEDQVDKDNQELALNGNMISYHDTRDQYFAKDDAHSHANLSRRVEDKITTSAWDDELDFLTRENRLKLELSSLVIERRENLNLVWGVGCDSSFVRVKKDPMFPLLALKHDVLEQKWREDLEKRNIRITCYSLWNDQVLILTDDNQSLAELYLMEPRFLQFIMSILGSRCPPGSYFAGLLNESSMIIVRRDLFDARKFSREECLTFLRRLGYFIKNGKIPTIYGKHDLYDQHEGKLFQWRGNDIHASFLPNFELVGIEDLTSISLPSSALENLFYHYNQLRDKLELNDADEKLHLHPRNQDSLMEFFDERNPFSWRYMDQWFRPLPPLDPNIEGILRNFNKHLDELPLLHDYFPENPLARIKVPVFWAFSFHYAIRMGTVETFYVPLEELWNGFYSVADMRKFQLSLILAKQLIASAVNVKYDDLVIDFQIPAVLQFTVAQEELNQMMLAFQQLNPEDFEVTSKDVDIIMSRLRTMYPRLSPFWKQVLSFIN